MVVSESQLAATGHISILCTDSRQFKIYAVLDSSLQTQETKNVVCTTCSKAMFAPPEPKQRDRRDERLSSDSVQSTKSSRYRQEETWDLAFGNGWHRRWLRSVLGASHRAGAVYTTSLYVGRDARDAEPGTSSKAMPVTRWVAQGRGRGRLLLCLLCSRTPTPSFVSASYALLDQRTPQQRRRAHVLMFQWGTVIQNCQVQLSTFLLCVRSGLPTFNSSSVISSRISRGPETHSSCALNLPSGACSTQCPSLWISLLSASRHWHKERTYPHLRSR